MQTSLLILGLALTMGSHWQHQRMWHQLHQGRAATGQRVRNRLIYQGLIYLGVVYVAIGVWQPTWLNARVVGLLLIVDGVALAISCYQRHRQTRPMSHHLLWRKQGWYLAGSQLLLGAVLLGTLLTYTTH